MKTLTMTPPMPEENATPIIEKLLSELDDGDTLFFEKGDYFLRSAINLENKKNFTFDGNGCTFVPYYDREAEHENDAEVIHVKNCSDLMLRNFKINASMPANSAGRIVNVTPNYADVKIDSRVPFTGREKFISGMTYTEDGVPSCCYWVNTEYDYSIYDVIAGEIPTSNPRCRDVPHETVGEQTYRVYSNHLDGLKEGVKCSVSHTYYGLSAIVFKNSEYVTLDSIHIENFGGFGIVILPRCKDFTFKNLRLQTSDPEHQPFALNSDGIHVTGLMGRLDFENCYFESCGDDFINVHTYVMAVSGVHGENIGVEYKKENTPKYSPVNSIWAEKGDGIRVYDPVTLNLKGVLTAECYSSKKLVVKPYDFEVLPGDLMTNSAYFVELTMRKCISKNPRERSFVFQSIDKMLIEECEFYGIHAPAVYCSGAFSFWYEAGPVQNVTVRNNRFYGSDFWRQSLLSWGAIFVRMYGDEYQDIEPTHKNIEISNNYFDGMAGCPIIINLTDGIKIKGNTFKNCHAFSEPIKINNSKNIVCESNISL